jgi:hypothetical protein
LTTALERLKRIWDEEVVAFHATAIGAGIAMFKSHELASGDAACRELDAVELAIEDLVGEQSLPRR